MAVQVAPRLVITDALGRRSIPIERPVTTFRAAQRMRCPCDGRRRLASARGTAPADGGKVVLAIASRNSAPFVNGEKITERELKPGDTIGLGQTSDTSIVFTTGNDQQLSGEQMASSRRARIAPHGGAARGDACARIRQGRSTTCSRWCSFAIRGDGRRTRALMLEPPAATNSCAAAGNGAQTDVTSNDEPKIPNMSLKQDRRDMLRRRSGICLSVVARIASSGIAADCDTCDMPGPSQSNALGRRQ